MMPAARSRVEARRNSIAGSLSDPLHDEIGDLHGRFPIVSGDEVIYALPDAQRRFPQGTPAAGARAATPGRAGGAGSHSAWNQLLSSASFPDRSNRTLDVATGFGDPGAPPSDGVDSGRRRHSSLRRPHRRRVVLHCLLAELSQREDLHLRLYGRSVFVHPNDEQIAGDLPRGPAIAHIAHRVPDDLSVSRDWLLSVLRALEPLLIAADGNRVVFAPNFVPPKRFRWARGGLVVTVHDLSSATSHGPFMMRRAERLRHNWTKRSHAHSSCSQIR